MEGLLLFVRFYHQLRSGLAFIHVYLHRAACFLSFSPFSSLKSLQSLQLNPADQSVYYQEQSLMMLAQISQQITSITPEVSISSTPPPPYPAFLPSQADIRVNAYWLIALMWCLSAALFATLGSVVYEGLSAVRSPIEASTIPTIVFRGCQRNAETGGSCYHTDPRFPLSILLRPWRCHPGFQHNTWYHLDCLYLRCWPILPVQLMVNPIESPYQTPISRIIFSLMRSFFRLPYS